MEFTQDDWGQRGIINKIIILTKQDTDKIHVVIPTKYQKYPSTTILNHANVLAEANKSLKGYLHNIMPHDAYSIIIHVRTMILEDISHKKKE